MHKQTPVTLIVCIKLWPVGKFEITAGLLGNSSKQNSSIKHTTEQQNQCTLFSLCRAVFSSKFTNYGICYTTIQFSNIWKVLVNACLVVVNEWKPEEGQLENTASQKTYTEEQLNYCHQCLESFNEPFIQKTRKQNRCQNCRVSFKTAINSRLPQLKYFIYYCYTIITGRKPKHAEG